jgi:hypothetical protein
LGVGRGATIPRRKKEVSYETTGPWIWTDPLDKRRGEKNAYGLLVGRPEGKRLLGRPRLMRKDYIKITAVEIGWGGVDWIGLAQDRDKWRSLVNAVMNLRFP